MRELNPQINLQHLLAQQIFNALQGEVTEDIRQKCLGNANDIYFHSTKGSDERHLFRRRCPY